MLKPGVGEKRSLRSALVIENGPDLPHVHSLSRAARRSDAPPSVRSLAARAVATSRARAHAPAAATREVDRVGPAARANIPPEGCERQRRGRNWIRFRREDEEGASEEEDVAKKRWGGCSSSSRSPCSTTSRRIAR
eukprot:31205-Pelagococcus_subviridis.AAC.12